MFSVFIFENNVLRLLSSTEDLPMTTHAEVQWDKHADHLLCQAVQRCFQKYCTITPLAWDNVAIELNRDPRLTVPIDAEQCLSRMTELKEGLKSNPSIPSQLKDDMDKNWEVVAQFIQNGIKQVQTPFSQSGEDRPQQLYTTRFTWYDEADVVLSQAVIDCFQDNQKRGLWVAVAEKVNQTQMLPFPMCSIQCTSRMRILQKSLEKNLTIPMELKKDILTNWKVVALCHQYWWKNQKSTGKINTTTTQFRRKRKLRGDTFLDLINSVDIAICRGILAHYAKSSSNYGLWDTVNEYVFQKTKTSPKYTSQWTGRMKWMKGQLFEEIPVKDKEAINRSAWDFFARYLLNYLGLSQTIDDAMQSNGNPSHQPQDTHQDDEFDKDPSDQIQPWFITERE